jgi:hypothetical protein
MARPAPATFSFFLSAHEWSVAGTSGDSYVMHFWDKVDPGPHPASARKAPFVVSPSSLVDHLPEATACSGPCRWESANVETAGS